MNGITIVIDSEFWKLLAIILGIVAVGLQGYNTRKNALTNAKVVAQSAEIEAQKKIRDDASKERDLKIEIMRQDHQIEIEKLRGEIQDRQNDSNAMGGLLTATTSMATHVKDMAAATLDVTRTAEKDRSENRASQLKTAESLVNMSSAITLLANQTQELVREFPALVASAIAASADVVSELHNQSSIVVDAISAKVDEQKPLLEAMQSELEAIKLTVRNPVLLTKLAHIEQIAEQLLSTSAPAPSPALPAEPPLDIAPPKPESAAA